MEEIEKKKSLLLAQRDDNTRMRSKKITETGHFNLESAKSDLQADARIPTTLKQKAHQQIRIQLLKTPAHIYIPPCTHTHL